MNCKLFITGLIVSCFLFISAGKASALDKDSFNVLNAPKMLDKHLFDISADVVKEKCHDCDCGCKETGKCKCGEKCPCDCGCGKSGKCKCKSANPFEIKQTKELSLNKLYDLVANGKNGVLFVGVRPTKDEQIGYWAFIPELTGGYTEHFGAYDCVLKNGINTMKKREVKVEVFQNYSNCPNGFCPNKR